MKKNNSQIEFRDIIAWLILTAIACLLLIVPMFFTRSIENKIRNNERILIK